MTSEHVERDLGRIAAHLEATLARRAVPEEVGGFALFIQPGPDPFYRNAALPLPADSARPLAPHLVRGAFAARGLPTRIELLEELRPEVTVALAQVEGLTAQRLPALALALPPPKPEASARYLEPSDGADALARHLRDLDLAMGGSGAIDPREVIALGLDLEKGSTRVAVRHERGRLIGTATLAQAGQVAELLAVWTAPERRHRGIARDLCSGLLADWLVVPGRLAWLGAASTAALRLYESLGFRRVGTHTAFVGPRPQID